MEDIELAESGAGAAPPWTVPAAALLAAAGSDAGTGLAEAEAARRLDLHGENRLAETAAEPPWKLFLRQFLNPLLIILLCGAAISAVTGHLIDTVAIAVIVFLNAAISFWQEYSAERSLAALREMAAPGALVLRRGSWQEIPAAAIVPGDIVRLKAGDIVPADLRFLEAHRLQIDEAALTGESEPVDKHDGVLDEAGAVLADRLNMGFMSTIVTNGSGIGLATGTGMDTEVGHIAGLMAAAKEPKTPLQQKVDALSHVLIVMALVTVAMVIGIGVIKGMPLTDMLGTAISLSVAAIPEGLPTVVTILLTLGSQKMVRSNALARRLSSVETLGSVSVICSDKTGTLTQNQMQVMQLWAGGRHWSVTGQGFAPEGAFLAEDGTEAEIAAEKDLRHMLMNSALCNDAVLTEAEGRPAIQGNPTDGALVVAAAKVGITRDGMMAGGVEKLSAFPFDSTRKMMSLHIRVPGGDEFLSAKGAPDVILRRATHLRLAGEEVPLDPARRAEVEEVIAGFGRDALRTLAIAYRRIVPGELDHADPEQQIVLLGIHGIMDPPRPEVRTAVAEAHAAGVRTVMITGDHAVTASAIAEAIGIRTELSQTVHTGAELDQMDDAALEAAVPKAAVFARVTPEHKLRIVRALQQTGEVASMTGDGVNDAPALRTADIGVAMGITGTSVAKDSSALILLDDNFSTIVGAVREGRRIYDNLLKFVRQALTANVAEVSVILLAFLLMGEHPVMPITPLMILWVNLVSDGMPALTLGFEAEEENVMARPPRPRDHSMFGEGMKERILIRGLAIGATSFWVFSTSLGAGAAEAYAQTLAFVTLISGQIWHIFDARTTSTLFRRSPFGNRQLLMAVAGSVLLSLGAIYTGFGHLVLGTAPVDLPHLLGAAAVAALPVFALSGIKELFGLKWL
ncbi:cation-translocating P-type ATPase [Poseidonocella sp. HB161398]|uniref:cation-translocating P-type ATPase n=1 Tax=Poseidonocella sp. HB161398 TaxID=2320855 RepID=UPI001109E736|nr:cation-translocating P-type ATPase [Poseidonocella sp. HB161398]